MKQRALITCCAMSILFSGFWISCTRELEFDKLSTDNLSGEWAFPLINSTITIDDILTDTSGAVNTGDDGLITLIYEADEMISIDGKERTTIPDQVKMMTETIDLPTVPLNAEAEIPLSFDFVFELLDENHRVDTMELKQGNYTIRLRTNLNKNAATIDLVVNNFIHWQTGEPMSTQFNISNPGGGELELSWEVDLKEYYVQFHNEIPFNTVYIDGLVTFQMDNNPNLSPYTFQLINEFEGVAFSKFVGFIAENEESYADSIPITLFNSTDFSSILFGPESVRLNFDVFNSLGLPVVLELERFTAYNTVNSTDSIELTLNPSSIAINYPSFEDFNTYSHTEINTDFVDVNAMLAISPDILYLNFTGHINRDMPPETINYFADNSNLMLEASIEVDLFAGVESFEVADTLDFDPASLENVNMAEFMVEIENGFPILADIQVRFMDPQFNPLFDLFENATTLIEAGKTGPAPDYRVTSSATRKTFVVLEREKLELLQQAEKLLFSAVMSTEDNEFVKIYSDYTMNLKLGAKVIYTY